MWKELAIEGIRFLHKQNNFYDTSKILNFAIVINQTWFPQKRSICVFYQYFVKRAPKKTKKIKIILKVFAGIDCCVVPEGQEDQKVLIMLDV